ncbi:hypothetical protein [Deinococcus indicus]|uniref:hypothetical protein n=1 Tax=Deinococcus indicus TaxID=223556 RepID=UPI00174E141A|nr:hypothetical protein [Deinococcus indicus]
MLILLALALASLWSPAGVAALRAALMPENAVLLVVVTALAVLVSVTGLEPAGSLLQAGLLTMVLWSAFIIVRVAGLPAVLRAFGWAGVICTGITLAYFASQPALVIGALQGVRPPMPLGFHPNTLGFLLVGFALGQPWFERQTRWRFAISVGTALSAFALINIVSSRASLAGLLGGALVLAALRSGASARAILRPWVIIAAGLLGTLGWTLATAEATQERAASIAAAAVDLLQLNNEGRGVGTGLSGRGQIWESLGAELGHGAWVAGVGYRVTADSIAIDNSYLVLAYEMGIVPTVLIVGKFLLLLALAAIAYARAPASARGLYGVIVALIVAHLINNYAARYLIAVGNPFSLMMLFILVMPASALGALPQRHAKMQAIIT